MELRYMELNGISGHEAGRKLLNDMYLEKNGKMMPQILTGERGKPYFAEDAWYFSISHTKHYVFCALSERPIGIDAEETDRKVDLRLAGKILSQSEKCLYEASEDKQAALLRLWVLKEATAKLTGEGINGYPNRTDFTPDDPRIQKICNCYVAVVEDPLPETE